MRTLDQTALREMVYGGAVLGAGGGGTIEAGLAAGVKALAEGAPRLVRLSDLCVVDRVVTFSRVGTVSGSSAVTDLEGYDLRALDLFHRADRAPIAGFIASEVGPLAVTYGWRASARTGVPVIDAPCNGRAHPLGLMGSLGLHRLPQHRTLTAVAGPAACFISRANVIDAAATVRKAVAQQGAGVAVVRNPVPASYLLKHAAVGALSYARRIGHELLRHRRDPLPALKRLMGGRILARGFVKINELIEQDGFSLGHVAIRTNAGRQLIVPIVNEYMMVFDAGRPIAAFPDLIALFDETTALPLPSADAQPTRPVVVFTAPRHRLLLAPTMYDPELLAPIERLLQLRFPVAA
jgi:DUF917 family protein